jgi:hypothetical protein
VTNDGVETKKVPDDDEEEEVAVELDEGGMADAALSVL